MKIRAIEAKDAQAFGKLQEKLDRETKFMLFEPEERQFDLDRTISQIAQTDFLIGADISGELVGFLAARSGKPKRVRHVAYIVIGILKEFGHQGIGSQFFTALDKWAMENQIKRLELTVIAENHNALALYKKFGFQIEGTKVASMYIDGEFVDEFYMGKIFDEKKE